MGKLKASDHQSFMEKHLKAVKEEIWEEREKMPREESIDEFQAVVRLKLLRHLELGSTLESISNALQSYTTMRVDSSPHYPAKKINFKIASWFSQNILCRCLRSQIMNRDFDLKDLDI